MAEKSNSIPQAAAALGYLGALPFILMSFAMWFVEPDQVLFLIDTIVIIGAVVLAYIGGIQLGVAMASEEGPNFSQLGIGAVVIIAASGIITMPMPNEVALGILVVAFIAQLFIDMRTSNRFTAPAWYSGLQIPLAVLVELSLIGALAKAVMI